MHSKNLFWLVIYTLAVVTFNGKPTDADAPKPMGTLKCRVTVQWSEEFENAYITCSEKIEKEHEGDKDKKPHQTYPINATVEDFEYDDQCQAHCVFETMRISTQDSGLPEKKNTGKILLQGKVPKNYYEKYITFWDSCFEQVEKVAKSKGLDKCKTASLFDHCFFRNMRESKDKLDVEC